MVKEGKVSFPWCNAASKNEADVVIIGVKSERGSRARRRGSSLGPDAARRASAKFDEIDRKGAVSIMYSDVRNSSVNAYDYGNMPKTKVMDFARKQAFGKQALGCVGGDHSITYEILKGIDRSVDSWGFLYIDAHPDIVGSEGSYYGSVVNDILSLENVKAQSSVILGARAIEVEEMDVLKSSGIKIVSMERIVEEGIVAISEYVKGIIPKNAYVSIDLDAVDPAFAPGVSTPVPGGLDAREILYIASAIGKSINLGFDVMELNPRYDSGYMTAHLASLIMMNISASIRKR